MAGKIPRMKSEDVTRVLSRHGFFIVSQRGSHQKWRNTETGRQVIVPSHKSRQLPLGTMRSIIDGSGIPSDQFLS